MILFVRFVHIASCDQSFGTPGDQISDAVF